MSTQNYRLLSLAILPNSSNQITFPVAFGRSLHGLPINLWKQKKTSLPIRKCHLRCFYGYSLFYKYSSEYSPSETFQAISISSLSSCPYRLENAPTAMISFEISGAQIPPSESSSATSTHLSHFPSKQSNLIPCSCAEVHEKILSQPNNRGTSRSMLFAVHLIEALSVDRSLDRWSDQDIRMMALWGNDRSNAYNHSQTEQKS